MRILAFLLFGNPVPEQKATRQGEKQGSWVRYVLNLITTFYSLYQNRLIFFYRHIVAIVAHKYNCTLFLSMLSWTGSLTVLSQYYPDSRVLSVLFCLPCSGHFVLAVVF
jgi:hypothetical protein